MTPPPPRSPWAVLASTSLAVFAVFAAWRLTQPWPVREVETIGHVAVDTLVLGSLLYFTGGASNPFVTLLLVPIALAAESTAIDVTASRAMRGYILGVLR